MEPNPVTVTNNAFLILKQLYALQVQHSMLKQILCDNYYSYFVPMIHTFIIAVSSLGSKFRWFNKLILIAE
jgi:hypothetical protein